MQRFKTNWTWTPNESQTQLFEKWKDDTMRYLVSCQNGSSIRSIPGWLLETIGEDIPLDSMGFRSVNEFLYEMNDCIEVRKIPNGRLFVFIRESAIPPKWQHIRDEVIGQADSKFGVTKLESMYVPPEELLKSAQQVSKPRKLPFNPSGSRLNTMQPAKPIDIRKPSGQLQIPKNSTTSMSFSKTASYDRWQEQNDLNRHFEIPVPHDDRTSTSFQNRTAELNLPCSDLPKLCRPSLDASSVLSQVFPCLKDGSSKAVRIRNEMPQIRFPPYVLNSKDPVSASLKMFLKGDC